jgi:hypothetical protein
MTEDAAKTGGWSNQEKQIQIAASSENQIAGQSAQGTGADVRFTEAGCR